jgi:hypothetical protein
MVGNHFLQQHPPLPSGSHVNPDPSFTDPFGRPSSNRPNVTAPVEPHPPAGSQNPTAGNTSGLHSEPPQQDHPRLLVPQQGESHISSGSTHTQTPHPGLASAFSQTSPSSSRNPHQFGLQQVGSPPVSRESQGSNRMHGTSSGSRCSAQGELLNSINPSLDPEQFNRMQPSTVPGNSGVVSRGSVVGNSVRPSSSSPSPETHHINHMYTSRSFQVPQTYLGNRNPSNLYRPTVDLPYPVGTESNQQEQHHQTQPQGRSRQESATGTQWVPGRVIAPATSHRRSRDEQTHINAVPSRHPTAPTPSTGGTISDAEAVHTATPSPGQ